MSKKSNTKISKFTKSLSIRTLTRFISEIALFTLVLFILILLGILILYQKTWRGDELLYPLLTWIKDRIIGVIILIASIGYIVIFIYNWLKTLGYLEDIIEATENIYDSKEQFIELPIQLKEVENKLNQIKLNVQNNERAAREAEQRKNDLVVYLAHDLKTPLTSVIGYLTLLHDEKQISEELRLKYLSISLDKAERLEDLINEFFEITRFSLSNLTLELSRINLTRLLEQLTYEFKPMFAEKGLDCVLNVPTDLNIRCDVNKIQRVFDNLLRNAVNYSFEDSTIEITVTRVEDGVTLQFQNHGNAIPREKLNRIFEQFYRLDTARTSRSGGAGLGLAIAKEIIELHQGRIKAFSEDEIILFEVNLPVL